jgi:hypothetical protein
MTEEGEMSSHSYQIVGSEKKEESLYFMLNSPLQSRIDTGEETTDDEDVNVCLANLLHSFLDTDDHQKNASLVSSYETDVAGIADTEDLRKRYRVFRTNGDHALIFTSIFDRPFPDRRRRSTRIQDTVAAADRGRTYYGYAANLSDRINRTHPGVSVVLRKLSERFHTYVTILTRVRIDHLKFTTKLSDAEMYHIQRAAHNGAKPFIASEGRDQFLDAYSDWMKSKTPVTQQKVNLLGESLAEVDPEFDFEPV